MTSSSGTGCGLRWPKSSMSKAHSFGSTTRLACVNPGRPAGGRHRQPLPVTVPGLGRGRRARRGCRPRLRVAAVTPRPPRMRVEQLGQRVLEVLLELLGRPLELPRRQQVDQRAVAGDVRLVQPLRARHGVERQPQLGEQPLGDLVGPRAAGQRHEIAVELHVGGADRHPVTPPEPPPPPAATSSYSRCSTVRVDVRERPDHVALDRAPEPVEVDEVRLVELADEDPAVQLVDQQTLVRQQPEGLAQRVARDPAGPRSAAPRTGACAVAGPPR